MKTVAKLLLKLITLVVLFAGFTVLFQYGPSGFLTGLEKEWNRYNPSSTPVAPVEAGVDTDKPEQLSP